MRQQEKVAAILLGAAVVVLSVAIIFGLKGGHKGKSTSGVSVNADSGSGVKAGELNAPRGVAVDQKGFVYVVDGGNHRIQKFDKDGKVIKTWGREGEGESQFKTPGGIDIGSNGNVFVADTWNHRVQVFDPNGKFLRLWFGDEGFWGPRDLAVDADGSVYVTDTGNRRIQKFNDNGDFLIKWGQQGKGPDEFDEPFGIKCDNKGLLYICDRLNFRIKVTDNKGKFVRSWPIDGWQVEQFYMEPYIAVDSQRNLVYVTDPTKHRVHKFNLKGESVGVIDTTPDGQPLGTPVGVGVNQKSGTVYITDMTQNKLFVYQVQEAK